MSVEDVTIIHCTTASLALACLLAFYDIPTYSTLLEFVIYLSLFLFYCIDMHGVQYNFWGIMPI